MANPNSRQSTAKPELVYARQGAMKTNSVYIGIDVSKKTLHVGSPIKFLLEVSNNGSGHQELIEFLKGQELLGVVLEASGGYERAVCDALQDAEVPVSVCQPSCIRHFAKSIKVLAKTDKIDAVLIARFGEAVRPPATPKTPENTRKIRALMDRRQQVVEDRVRECNRLQTCVDPQIAKQIKASIKQLQTVEDKLEHQLQCFIQEDEELKAKAHSLMKQKGVGLLTARTLLANMPELGSLSRQQVAALAGLAPYPRESGNWKGKRKIFGGRAEVRKAMFMAAKTAARWCPVISQFYKSLRAQGKPYKVAIIACARKMLIYANTVLKEFAEKESQTASEA
jgi:transposase